MKKTIKRKDYNFPGRSYNLLRNLKLKRILYDNNHYIKTVNCSFSTNESIYSSSDYKISLISNITKIMNNVIRQKIKIDNIFNIDDGLFINNQSSIIITNANIGQLLSSRKDFSDTCNYSNSMYCYEIGNINNHKIYVNNLLNWDKNIIYLIKKPFYDIVNVKIREEEKLVKNIIEYDIYYEKDLNNCIEIYEINF